MEKKKHKKTQLLTQHDRNTDVLTFERGEALMKDHAKASAVMF